MKKNEKTLLGIIVSIAVIYATVYYGGKAWKRSQAGEKLV
jgi:hypothetical protein